MLSLMRNVIAAASLVGAFGFTAPAHAEAGASEATLAQPAMKPLSLIIDGRQWTCSGANCAASASDIADSQPVSRECKRAAAELGAFSAYRSGSKALNADQLAACNAGIQPPKLETVSSKKH